MPNLGSQSRGQSADPDRRPSSGRWPVYVIGLAALGLAAVAIPGAIDWYEQPIAGVLVGPDAVVSGTTNSSWDGSRQGLRFPDRIVAIDGYRLDGLARAESGQRVALLVKRAASSRASRVWVDVRQGNSERRIQLAIERLDGATWWRIAGSLFFAGALFVVAGLVAIWVSPRARLARSFAVLAIAAAVFMLTFFDYQTSYRLVPLFLVAFAMVPGAVCMLALRLPDDAPVLLRLPWLERAITAGGLAVATYFVVPYLRGRSLPALHDAWGGVLGASFLFFVATFIVRYVLARGHRRDILRVLTLAMAPPFAVVGMVWPRSRLFGRVTHADVLTYPVLAVAPISVAFAFVRYDLWGSRAFLSRFLTKLVIGIVACSLAIAAGAALASDLGVPFRAAVIAATSSGVISAILVLLALRAVEVRLFPSRAGYKPTVEQLSVDLISITSPDEVGRAIERTVRRWLPCDHIRLVPAQGGPDETHGTVGAQAPESVITHEMAATETEPGERPDLTLPVVFGNERLGVLEVGAKPGGALFTSDDLDLLGTVVNQGALALAHARAYQELEQRRRQQAAAWRGEREALVETVAAEISHEIRYPLNFFRSLFSRAKPPGPADIEIGREEVERLERLVAGLRRMVAHRLQRRAVSIRELCGRAEMLLRDAAQGRQMLFEGEANLAVRCDADQATQILVNLLANALQATDSTGKAGVSWTRDGQGARVEVWDDGPGFVGARVRRAHGSRRRGRAAAGRRRRGRPLRGGSRRARRASRRAARGTAAALGAEVRLGERGGGNRRAGRKPVPGGPRCGGRGGADGFSQPAPGRVSTRPAGGMEAQREERGGERAELRSKVRQRPEQQTETETEAWAARRASGVRPCQDQSPGERGERPAGFEPVEGVVGKERSGRESAEHEQHAPEWPQRGAARERDEGRGVDREPPPGETEHRAFAGNERLRRRDEQQVRRAGDPGEDRRAVARVGTGKEGARRVERDVGVVEASASPARRRRTRSGRGEGRDPRSPPAETKPACPGQGQAGGETLQPREGRRAADRRLTGRCRGRCSSARSCRSR